MIQRYLNLLKTKFGVPTIVSNGPLKYYCPSFMEMWRVETLYTKEPETIEWINNFPEHSILWDIGANVGMYTIYAANKGHFVVAFEPSSREYGILKKNIELNNVWVDARNVFLTVSSNYKSYPTPDYIKIDTDGFDYQILQGFESILPNIKSLLIELDPKLRSDIILFMEENGFMLLSETASDMFKGTPYADIKNGIFVHNGVAT